jgi:hypothetical protein
MTEGYNPESNGNTWPQGEESFGWKGKVISAPENEIFPLNALKRDGSSQTGRFPAALAKDYFKIDERGLEELLDFTVRLAAEVKFHGVTVGEPDWQPFFKNDPSVVLAQVIRYPLGEWKLAAEAIIDDVRQLVKAIRARNSAVLQPEEKDRLLAAIDLLAKGSPTLASPITSLQSWVSRLQNALQFQTDLANTEKGAVKRQKEDLEGLKIRLNQSYMQPNELSEALEKVHTTMGRVSSALGTILGNLQIRSKQQFGRSLSDYASHGPHLGLFIAFLQVFQHAKDRLNEILPAHLDFYYREVLRFAPKEATPEKVHLIAALSAQASQLLLPAGTAFASSDKRQYATTEDWVFNRAQIGKLLAVQRARGLFALEQGKGELSGLGWPAHEGLAKIRPATVGWALSSQVLRMQSGRRRVQIGFALLPNSNEPKLDVWRNPTKADRLGMTVSISTVEGWKSVPITDARLLPPYPGDAVDHFIEPINQDSELLFLELTMDADFPPILGCDAALHGEGWNTVDPVVKLEMEIGGAEAWCYEFLTKAIVLDWNITVAVCDQQPLMENDQSGLDGSKTFAPFGTQPAINNRWSINIQEAASKQNLRELSLNWFWGQLNANEIPEYFAGYAENLGIEVKTSEFASQMALYHGDRLTQEIGLRELYGVTSTRKRRIRFGGISTENHEKLEDIPVFPNLPAPNAIAGVRDGFNLQFTLTGPPIAFGHQHYALAYANASKKLQKLHVESLNNPGEGLNDSKVKFPNPPITPTITNVRLSYLATDGGTALEKFGTVKFYHLSAFGYAEESKRESLHLFPQYPLGAALYIGLVDAVPQSQLNLLVQMRSGSGDPELPLPAVNWQYLQGNSWQAFLPSEILADDTLGLRQSGIVRFNIPPTADYDHQLLPSGFIWLRLEAAVHAAALERIEALHVQAAVVTLQTSLGSTSSGQLNGHQLSKPVQYVAGLKEVKQPYGSFGGAKAASEQQFQAQVAERLRHKNRSIAILDYEKIVLEHFPAVSKVKCINHAAPKGALKNGVALQHDNELSAGHLTVVCIPKTPNVLASNPLQPRFGRDVLGTIRDFLQAEVPPFVTVHAVNASYLEIRLSGQVVFKPHVDAGIGMGMLHTAIARYLCPWAFEEGEEIHFGGKIHRSQLLNLIEQQPYVDVVANFKMGAAGYAADEELIAATTSRMVLVPAQTQVLVAVAKEKLDYEGSLVYGGIGFWRVMQDFEVNGK